MVTSQLEYAAVTMSQRMFLVKGGGAGAACNENFVVCTDLLRLGASTGRCGGRCFPGGRVELRGELVGPAGSVGTLCCELVGGLS